MDAGPEGHSVAVWRPAEAAALSWVSLLHAGAFTVPWHLGWGALRGLMHRQHQ